MRHSKIPGKNRKKLKSVDPFNKKGFLAREKEKKKKNWEPKSNEVQYEPRALTDLQESIKNVDKKVIKQRKQKRNLILEEAAKMGLEKGRFETIHQFLRRVERTSTNCLAEFKALDKQGLLGRDQAELAADVKIITDREKEKKEKAKREVQNKIKKAKQLRADKEKRLKEKEDAKRSRQAARREAGEEPEEEHPVQEEEKMEADYDNEELGENDEHVQKSDEAEKKDGETPLIPIKLPKAKKIDKRVERKKVAKQAQSEQRRTEAVLNSREVIAFGERYDAPPTFSGIMKKQMDPLMAKAGGKNLLLHAILAKETGVKTQYLEDEDKKRTVEEERLRVIEAYRQAKRQRYLNN